MSSQTDRELLQDILRRLARIEEHLGLTEYKSEIGVPRKPGYRTERNAASVPVTPAKLPGGPQPMPGGPVPEPLSPDPRKGPPTDPAKKR
jgi:hypothetical protein